MHKQTSADDILRDAKEFAEKYSKEEPYISPYANLDKAKVLQDAHMFHDPILVRENPRKCCTIIAQLVYLQNNGPGLNNGEATEVFFGATKLFMSYDACLRRMLFLFIKSLAETCSSNDMIIATSSLTKDISLCVFARIVDDVATLKAVGPYFLENAMLDKSGHVSSAALVSAVDWFQRNESYAAVIRCRISEITDAAASSKYMRVLTNKANALGSPLALALLVRYTSSLLADAVTVDRHVGSNRDATPKTANVGMSFLKFSFRHKSELVRYEAARSICCLPDAASEDLNEAVATLQLFLYSPKPVTRFAAMNTLATVANQYPQAVTTCNKDFELLIRGNSRNIGPKALNSKSSRTFTTMAIAVLQKSWSKIEVEKLLKDLSLSFAEEDLDTHCPSQRTSLNDDP